MAGALVSMVMEKIGEALVSKVMEKLREEVSSVVGAQAELEKISSKFESIQALLNDAEIMQFKNESMQVWLKKLKDVAYDVEDLVDEMNPWPEPESRTDDGDDRQSKGKRKWSSLFSSTDGDDTDNRSIGDKCNFAHQMKEASAKLDQIVADKRNYSCTEIHSFRGGSHPDKAEFRTSSRVDESQMLSDEEGRIPVISIIGVGGLGKTTLAQLICKDERMDFIKAEEKEGFFLLKIGGPLSPISHNPSAADTHHFYYFVYSSIEDPPHLTGSL